jgi:cobalamin synthase
MVCENCPNDSLNEDGERIASSMLADFFGAFIFLTILPARSATTNPPGRTFACFPLVGLVIGALVGLTATITFLPHDVVALTS